MSKAQYQRNKEKIKAASAKWLAEHQEVRLYGSCKANAARRGIEFTISVKDIRIPEVCPIMGIPLTNIMGKGRQSTNASVDRIRSDRGYVKGNVWVISDLANRMKQNATKDELVAFAEGIIDLYGIGSDSDLDED